MQSGFRASITSGIGTVNTASLNGSQVTVNLIGVANGLFELVVAAFVSNAEPRKPGAWHKRLYNA